MYGMLILNDGYIVLHFVISILTVAFISLFFLKNMIYKQHELQPTIFVVKEILDLPQFLLIGQSFSNWHSRLCT